MIQPDEVFEDRSELRHDISLREASHYLVLADKTESESVFFLVTGTVCGISFRDESDCFNTLLNLSERY